MATKLITPLREIRASISYYPRQVAQSFTEGPRFFCGKKRRRLSWKFSRRRGKREQIGLFAFCLGYGRLPHAFRQGKGQEVLSLVNGNGVFRQLKIHPCPADAAFVRPGDLHLIPSFLCIANLSDKLDC
uniref:Uncharacterized protein n=1 Tax=Chromera velia CCMP2878 TaxID=1169474 RepID=A0A0G4IEQ9_9ALVE|eukprot:Cvel_13797.t1-p1 / transcript=Cvel_13797.t1 / gene=Cvel_13797 / organism=Chromera_velia_CCMP2878 / gene_product=hypothetical protein / transcript_product=hypothetical protein / location=Cvel_scaffold957:6781-7164(+) / protein_length=128 / sequence_SO=supercontig / SO=protein_coding / is_pseudo=false